MFIDSEEFYPLGARERVGVNRLKEILLKTLIDEQFLINDVPEVNGAPRKSVMIQLVYPIFEYSEPSNLFFQQEILGRGGLSSCTPGSFTHGLRQRSPKFSSEFGRCGHRRFGLEAKGRCHDERLFGVSP
ncbi:hypothetical protein Tco_1237040 [Tanacetum coccineum]